MEGLQVYSNILVPLDGSDLAEKALPYAVNLAKRVESHSRNGRYTNVFLSEAGHG
ncbi:MAG: universal stress protein, partial [Chloroflexi bacterium]|nr:universal stress protein [Chloroflexota bacterium]